jgi:AraC family transcriptional regulator
VSQVIFVPAGASQALHRHPAARLVLFLDGVYVERAFAQSAACTRGCFIIRPGFYAHDGAAPERDARYVRLGVSAKAARAFFSRHGWSARRGCVALDAKTLAAMRRDPFAGDALLRHAATRPLERPPARTRLEAVAHALADGADAPLQALAEQNGMKPWTLSRAFTRSYGVRPSAFRLQARLQHAMQLLAETSAPFAAIAAQAGLADQSHFTHALKRSTGLTPSALRREIALG